MECLHSVRCTAHLIFFIYNIIICLTLFYWYNKKRAYKCRNTRTNSFFWLFLLKTFSSKTVVFREFGIDWFTCKKHMFVHNYCLFIEEPHIYIFRKTNYMSCIPSLFEIDCLWIFSPFHWDLSPILRIIKLCI